MFFSTPLGWKFFRYIGIIKSRAIFLEGYPYLKIMGKPVSSYTHFPQWKNYGTKIMFNIS